MMSCVQLLQPFTGDMSVYLCGGNIGMAKQQLHHAQIRAVIEQMRGKRMAQRVRRQGFG